MIAIVGVARRVAPMILRDGHSHRQKVRRRIVGVAKRQEVSGAKQISSCAFASGFGTPTIFRTNPNNRNVCRGKSSVPPRVLHCFCEAVAHSIPTHWLTSSQWHPVSATAGQASSGTRAIFPA